MGRTDAAIGAAKAGHACLEPGAGEHVQDVPEILVRAGIPGVDLQGPPVGLHGLLQAALMFKGMGQVHVIRRHRRVGLDGFADQGRAGAVGALVDGVHADAVEDIAASRVLPEDPLIEGRGILELPALMQCLRLSESVPGLESETRVDAGVAPLLALAAVRRRLRFIGAFRAAESTVCRTGSTGPSERSANRRACLPHPILSD